MTAKKNSKKTRTPGSAATSKPDKVETPAKPMSGLDAAAKVLAESKEPMSAKQIVETALAKGLWKTGGATPQATIYAAMIREIAAKGGDARFRKVARGRFTAA